MLKSKRNYKPGKMDDCQTPGYALDPLEIFLSKDRDLIVDPACGERYLIKRFDELGYKSSGFDISTGTDFLYSRLDDYFVARTKNPVIVTNPPFSLKYRFLDKCYELGLPFALLMPVETIGAKTAQDMFRENGIEIIWLDKRINFKMPFKGWTGLGSHFSCAWFTSGLGIGQQNRFAICDNWTKEYRQQFEY